MSKDAVIVLTNMINEPDDIYDEDFTRLSRIIGIHKIENKISQNEFKDLFNLLIFRWEENQYNTKPS